ncbi:hypothetical protein N9L40_01450 [Rhodobacteraceae bacterium]|nr:hypothetical protein [Paracoccaceae bacterium]
MRSFNELRQDKSLPTLEKRFLKVGSVLISSAKSRRFGNTAVTYLKKGLSILNKPISQKAEDSVDQRLEKIEKALVEVCNALISIRGQIGGTTAVSTSAALFADKAMKKR